MYERMLSLHQTAKIHIKKKEEIEIKYATNMRFGDGFNGTFSTIRLYRAFTKATKP